MEHSCVNSAKSCILQQCNWWSDLSLTDHRTTSSARYGLSDSSSLRTSSCELEAISPLPSPISPIPSPMSPKPPAPSHAHLPHLLRLLFSLHSSAIARSVSDFGSPGPRLTETDLDDGGEVSARSHNQSAPCRATHCGTNEIPPARCATSTRLVVPPAYAHVESQLLQLSLYSTKRAKSRPRRRRDGGG